MSTGAAFLLAGVLLVGNAFFVGAAFAVLAARRSQIELRSAAGGRGGRTALWAMEHVPLMLAGSQLGVTICSLGLGAVAEPAVGHLVEPLFAFAGLPDDLAVPVSFAIALTLVMSLHVVLGEMLPKNLALAGPDRAALILAPPLVAFSRAFRALISFLNAIAYRVLRLVGVEPRGELTSAFTAEEVRSIVTESRREGLLRDEHGLVTGSIEFSDRLAGDLMVPLRSLVTVQAGGTPADVERLVARTGFSRYPVVPAVDGTSGVAGQSGIDGTSGVGDVLGYLHVKDLLQADDMQYEQPVPEQRLRGLASVSAGDEVEEALAAMQRSGSHLALVADGEGRSLGVLFLEDVLEELVGEVRDATQRNGHH